MIQTKQETEQVLKTTSTIFIQFINMYYISDNKEDLIQYNRTVAEGEQYDGTFTTDWANIIEHKDGNQFAILKHRKYNDDALQLVEDLEESWFDLPF